MVLDVAKQLGTVIGKNIRETKNQNQELSHSSGEDTYVIFPTEQKQTEEAISVAKTRLIGTAFILGHSTNGILGAGGTELGAGTLGDFAIIRAINPNNTFKEYFNNSNFNDTGVTDCTVNTTDGEATFANTEIYQTTIIFANSVNILKVRPTINVRAGSNQIRVDTGVGSQTLNIYTF